MSSKRDRIADRVRQSEKIRKYGFPVDFPCEYCVSKNQSCIMDSKSRNCASCTRRGRKCEKRFHSANEWNRLQEEEDRISRELREAESSVMSSNEAQALLLRQLSEIALQQSEALAKVQRLRKQQKFLKERGSKMLDHDTNVMDVLDEEDPEGIPPSTPPEGRELNATLDNFPALGFSNPPLPTDFSFSDLLALDEAALQRSR
jgi:hypothetical protein